MTGKEFKAALERLGWSQAALARRLGVHVNSVANWARDGAPRYVAEYLRVMALASQMLEGKHDAER